MSLCAGISTSNVLRYSMLITSAFPTNDSEKHWKNVNGKNFASFEKLNIDNIYLKNECIIP